MQASQPFTVGRDTIFKTLISTPSSGWTIWIVLLIGIMFIAVGCFVDIRWLIIGMLICLAVVPALAFFIYFAYVLASDMVANVVHHTVERQSDGYVLRIFRKVDDESGDAESAWIESQRLSIFDSNIVKVKTTNEYEIVFLKDSPLSILYVPRY